MATERKRGALSTEEMKFIEDNRFKMNVRQIANELNRNTPPIKKYIETIELRTRDVEEYSDLINALRKKFYYDELQKQFTKPEIRFFEYQWCDYIKQFNGDVTHTEEMQIIETIRTEILINRGLTDRRNIDAQIEELEEIIQEEMQRDRDDRDRDLISMLKQQIGSLMGSKSAYSSEHKNLTDRKEKLMISLKGTRDQRKKNAEDAKTNFTVWLKEILDDEKKMAEMEFEMELHRIAAEKAKHKLADYHVYQDGIIDQPLLTSETLLDGEENENN